MNNFSIFYNILEYFCGRFVRFIIGKFTVQKYKMPNNILSDFLLSNFSHTDFYVLLPI